MPKCTIEQFGMLIIWTRLSKPFRWPILVRCSVCYTPSSSVGLQLIMLVPRKIHLSHRQGNDDGVLFSP